MSTSSTPGKEPAGSFPGVDDTEVYEVLDRHDRD